MFVYYLCFKNFEYISQRRMSFRFSLFIFNVYLLFPYVRLPALYSMDDGSRQGFLLHVGGKEIKNKNCWPADVGGKKNKREKLTNFQCKWQFLEEKRTGQAFSILHVGGKKKQAEMATFFSCRTYFQLIGGLVIRRI